MDKSMVIQIIVIIILLPIIYKYFLKKYRKFTYSKKYKHTKDNMDGLSFEQYISSLFYRMGYRNKVTKGSHDFGADIILSNGNKKIVIQVKRYKSNVGIKAVQEVFTAQHYYKADNSYVVTNSKFTKSAIILANKIGVTLIDRNELKTLERRYIN
ncbi:restriction endonuclease [Macrococcus armenti]|uniref:restriction endonuclease n=1 Tax=Macrococcus armenti TaxID=2875764 RepID=UPI001CC9A5AF|nr:restriction endonuclease [Macrococcus armenti]UBH16580.1 restriction endonuclease [Macrococcus armenti]UBH21215.1 restriction endonuclease [Macrococcus armenti]